MGGVLMMSAFCFVLVGSVFLSVGSSSMEHVFHFTSNVAKLCVVFQGEMLTPHQG